MKETSSKQRELHTQTEDSPVLWGKQGVFAGLPPKIIAAIGKGWSMMEHLSHAKIAHKECASNYYWSLRKKLIEIVLKPRLQQTHKSEVAGWPWQGRAPILGIFGWIQYTACNIQITAYSHGR